MEKIKKLIYKALPYFTGFCAVAFALTVIWCIIALIFDL